MLEENELIPPVVIKDVSYVKFTVDPMGYKKFASISIDSMDSNSSADGVNPNIRMNRAAIIGQVTLLTSDGQKLRLDEGMLGSLPRKAGAQLVSKAFSIKGESGKIISGAAADGATTAIIYKLGTPIKTSNSEISELEFLAENFRDIEAVIASDNRMSQTLALLEKVAKPVGMLALPSWALDGISVMDGVEISQKVLPDFLS